MLKKRFGDSKGKRVFFYTRIDSHSRPGCVYRAHIITTVILLPLEQSLILVSGVLTSINLILD